MSVASAALARVDPEDYPPVLYIRSDRLSEQTGRDVYYKFADAVREKAAEEKRKERVRFAALCVLGLDWIGLDSIRLDHRLWYHWLQHQLWVVFHSVTHNMTHMTH